MPRTSPLVVFDCNIFWRAFFNRNGIEQTCYDLLVDEMVEHFVSFETIEELFDVLSREETLSKFPQFDIYDVEEFVRDIVSLSSVLESVLTVFLPSARPRRRTILESRNCLLCGLPRDD